MSLGPWGYCQRVDVGILTCSQTPVHCTERSLGSATGSTHRHPRVGVSSAKPPPLSWPGMVDPCGCHNPLHVEHGGLPVCCMPDWVPNGPRLFQPCIVCTVRPASIVEVPCGHINVCIDCYADYQTNARCLRCRGEVTARVDTAPFLDDVTGRPADCHMCKDAPSCVVTLPCVHMCLCARCLPAQTVGCPVCGARVERNCMVQWSGNEVSERISAAKATGSTLAFSETTAPFAVQGLRQGQAGRGL